MKIAVIGSGYVGLVTGACLTEMGNKVVCVDLNADKVAQLQAGLLHFSTCLAESIYGADYIFLAVGTPMAASGQCDLSAVFAAAESLSRSLSDYGNNHQIYRAGGYRRPDRSDCGDSTAIGR